LFLNKIKYFYKHSLVFIFITEIFIVSVVMVSGLWRRW